MKFSTELNKELKMIPVRVDKGQKISQLNSEIVAHRGKCPFWHR